MSGLLRFTCISARALPPLRLGACALIVTVTAIFGMVSASATTIADCQIQLEALVEQTNLATFAGRNAAKDRASLIGNLSEAQAKLDQAKYTDAIGKVTTYRRKVLTLIAEGKLLLGTPPTPDLVGGADHLIACIYSITSTNRAPTARAGSDQTVHIHTVVQLDGSGSSDPEFSALLYSWSLVSKPAGSEAVLSATTVPMPTFYADVAGTYVAQLIVNDGSVDSAPDLVQIYAYNNPPVAQAGLDQTVAVGTTISLDGTGSTDADGDPLDYAWQLMSVPDGSLASLTATTGPTSGFTVDRPGQYIVALVVDDGWESSDPDFVAISTMNSAPVADAGIDQTIPVGSLVYLDGTGSFDSDGDLLTYSWDFTSVPEGSLAALDDSTSAVPTFTADQPGSYVLSLVVNDGQQSSDFDTMVVATSNSAPVADAGSPQEAYVGETVTLDGTASSDADGDSLTYSWSMLNQPVNSVATLQLPDTAQPTFTPDIEGLYVAQLVVSDGSLDSEPDTTTVTVTVRSSVDSDADGLTDDEEALLGTDPHDADSDDDGLSDGAEVLLYTTSPVLVDTDGDGLNDGAEVMLYATSPILVDTDGDSFSDGDEVNGGSDPTDGQSTPGQRLPPDPATVAPAVDETVATDIFSSTEFLYTGADPIQTGVSPGTITLQRIAILRGRVLDRTEQSLPGVTVSVLGHPEFGQTLSRADGMFDLAVNGGGQLTLNYEKDGFLPAQRAVDAPWRDFAWLPEVILIPLDDVVTTIDLATPGMKTARGSIESDIDGTRQATVLFPEGTTASMVLPGGGTQALTTLNVRATEYTVGDTGPRAMPAELPPSSGYTYAVELSADEALAAGAMRVSFSQPLPVYVENFIGAPVGGAVPAGYYDSVQGRWVASQNGRVIKVVGITGGAADLDITGDDVADASSELAALGVTSVEQARLATLYTVGTELWRVPVGHFTPWDLNWPYGPPQDAISPPDTKPEPPIPPVEPTEDPCGSIIGCEDQSLGESLSITGTSLTLNYKSMRVPDRKDIRRINIPVSGPGPLPASLLRMRVDVTVAGRLYTQTFAPATGLTYTFIWDSKDVYGRPVIGERIAKVDVHYDYSPVYYALFSGEQLAAFGRPGFGGIAGAFKARATGIVTATQTFQYVIGGWDARVAGLGGWSIDQQHAYDPSNNTLLFGDGRQRSALSLANIITTAAGTGVEGNTGDGGQATAAAIEPFAGITAGPDGSVYFPSGYSIRRIAPDGVITTIAGGSTYGFSGDGGLATAARLESASDVAIGQDGSIYITDVGNNRVRRIGPDGIITTFAGNGIYAWPGEGMPATSTSLAQPIAVAAGPDGSVFIADTGKVFRVGTDGIITTYHDTGDYCGSCVSDVETDGAGNVYIVDNAGFDTGGKRIRRIARDGVVSNIAGGGVYAPPRFGDGGPATAAFIGGYVDRIALDAEGGIYISEERNGRIRYVSPSGIITTIAGEYPDLTYTTTFEDNRPALGAGLREIMGLALTPDGILYVTDTNNYRIRRIAPAMPGVSVSDVLLASEDGREAYQFTAGGRHLRTLDALTGVVRYQFVYGADGYLGSVTDGSGNVTTIERNGAMPTAIVAPGSQRTMLTVNADGWLTRAENPAGEAHTMTYTANGLLLSFTDPANNATIFTYDGLGRLVLDENPAAGSTTLARTELGNGFQVTTTSALGRVRTYRVEKLPNGEIRRTLIEPTGAQTVSVIRPDASELTTFSNGGTLEMKLGPDPRWGMQSPVTSTLVVTTPGGKVRTMTSTRVATLSDPSSLLSLTQLTETISDNGDVSTRVYSAAARTFTMTTPEGRTGTLTLDALGRMSSWQPESGLAPIVDTYDPQGRLVQHAQGTLMHSFGYDEFNRITSSTDPGGHVTTYAYDAADRMTRVTTSGGDPYEFAYDAAGNVTSVRMPSTAVHAFNYTALGQRSSYTPPGGGATAWAYDADRAWTGKTLPGGRTLTATYDAGGRPTGRSYPEAEVALDYGGATPRVAAISSTPLGGPAHVDAMTYDANLVLSVASSGAAVGTYAYSYDDKLRLAAMNLASGANTASIALTRDRDGLVTNYGPFAVTHNGPAGSADTIDDGTMKITNAYDALGRLKGRTHVVTGMTVYQLDLAYNAAGRIGERTETTDGGVEIRAYTYDTEGQLTDVSGSSSESYSYDANGNRSSAAAPATFDVQDRATTVGGVAYAYNADGYLATRGADAFQYSTRGELLAATIGGSTVTYSYDGLGRRISRTEGGATTQYFYGNPSNHLQLTASRESSGALTTYYYHGNGLIGLDRGGVRYYVVSDHAGSPRAVVNASGANVKSLQYDSYGRLLADSNPAFPLAVGYAGGLADATTQLVRFGFRDYNPTSGQWTSRDPLLFGGSLNLYGYADGDPVNNVDPLGLWGITIGFSAYEGIGGGASISIGGEGFSLTGVKGCLEAGVGIGGGLEVGLAENIGSTDFRISGIADASAGIGSAKLGSGFEITTGTGLRCPQMKGKFGLGEFSIQGKDGVVSDVKGKVGLKELGLNPPPSPKVSGASISAKLAGKICAGIGQ